MCILKVYWWYTVGMYIKGVLKVYCWCVYGSCTDGILLVCILKVY